MKIKGLLAAAVFLFLLYPARAGFLVAKEVSHMSNHELTGVTVYRVKDFPDPISQFKRALDGRYFTTVKTLFNLYPAFRTEYIHLLLAADLGVTRDGSDSRESAAVDAQMEKLKDLWHEQTVHGGPNNNNRWVKGNGSR